MNTFFHKNKKNLLKEAIIDQSSFLESLIRISKENLKPESYGKILLKIIDLFEENNIANLKGKKNKKARNKAGLIIHKTLGEVKGVDGSQFSLKGIRPLYSSIITFLEEKKNSDVSIDDCLLAADYYIKDFYPNLDRDSKDLVDRGKFSFEIIFEVTDFYKQYLGFKSSLNLFEKIPVFKVFEDDLSRVVYPTSPESFNNEIARSGKSVGWCTQVASTWFGYNSKQFVMIMTDKSNGNIISLKVRFNGTVDFVGTCDVNNSHMNESSVRRILSDEGLEAINNLVNTNKFFEFRKLDYTRFKNFSLKLMSINNFSEIKYMLLKSIDSEFFEDLAIDLFKKSFVINKHNELLDVYTEVICSTNFDFMLSGKFQTSWDYPLKNVNLQKEFFDIIYEKSKDKNNHVRYFIALCEIFNKNTFEYFIDDVTALRETLFIAVDKINPINFKKTIKAVCNNSNYKNMITNNNFSEILDSKGFLSYAENKKFNVLTYFKDNMSFVGRNEVDDLITKIILKNKTKFKNIIENTDSAKSIQAIDFGLISDYITKVSKSITKERFDFVSLSPYLLSINKRKLKELELKLYTDVNLVSTFFSNSSDVIARLCNDFFASLKNDSIKFDNNSYEVFCYLYKNVDKLKLSITNKSLDALINILLKFNKKFSELDQNTKNILTRSEFDITTLKSMIKVLSESSDYNKASFYISLLGSKTSFDNREVNNIFSFISKKVSSDNMLDNLEKNKESVITNYIINIPVFFNSVMNSFESLCVNRDDFYTYIYLVINGKLTSESAKKFFIDYCSIISNKIVLQDGKYTTGIPAESAKIVNRLIVQSITLNDQNIKQIFNMINLDSSYNQDAPEFYNLLSLIILKCNQSKHLINKEYLSKIMLNPSFKNLSIDLRERIYENFITISSKGHNYLDTKERFLVRNSLNKGIRKGSMHMKQDRDFILSLCLKLDDASKFQMRVVFPNEKSLSIKTSSIEESLIKKYVKLLFK